MNLNFGPNGILQFDDVRIIFRNFEGRGDKYNREGDRNFAILIETEEIKERLLNDVNKYGVPWNVKVKPPREEGDEPFMYLPVKLKFNGRGPNIYLSSGRSRTLLDEETVGCLDNADITRVDVDIRPYDNEVNGKPFRSAYVQALHVTQNVDRFAERFSGEVTGFKEE